MIRDELKDQVIKLLGDQVAGEVADIELTRTTNPKFGDFSTSVALKSTINKELETINPQKKAKLIADEICKVEFVEKAEVAGPGFVNIWIKPRYWQEQIREVVSSAGKFGSNNFGKGKKARVEFVSANPTGPLHFGNARGGPIGDVIANVLAFCGWDVLREYIDNDRGNQVLELGKTLAARAGLIKVKEDELAYKGEYTIELAKKIKPHLLRISSEDEELLIKTAGELGVKALFEEIIGDCKAIGINFDKIVHESDLQAVADSKIRELEAKGFIKKKDGALWFSPRLSPDYTKVSSGKQGFVGQAENEFLKDRDAVVVKSDGNYTYFTADVVYHTEKFESGCDLVVDVFGSNTLGHVPKLKALASVLDFDLEKFIVILYQFVRIKRGNDIVKMSKRAGNFVTAKEVLDEVGRDVLRFFILMHDVNSPIDFDLELAREHSSKNPVYYVQYAHARIAGILANDEGLTMKDEVSYELLTTDHELDLIKKITKLPELVEDISGNFAVHCLTGYAREVADSFHKFYENCKVISDDEELTSARLELSKAAQIVLKNTLSLLGVSAPDKM